MSNKTILSCKNLALFCFSILTYFNGLAQYLPNTLDLAAGGNITGGQTNGVKGAIGRDFYSFTVLSPNESFTVDIGTSLPVAFVTFGAWFAGDNRFIPAGYNIDYSDNNANWTNLASVTGNTNLNPVHAAANVSARFWRLTVTACQPGISASNISGFQLITTSLGSAIGNNFWSTPWAGSNIFTYSPVCIGGTYAPSNYKLAVNGSAIATSMTVKLDIWSDYVLKKGYHLRPLSEVDRYIAANSHLPDLPSQNEVISQGLDLGQINNLLTKKVEELTLYVLALDKKQKKQEQVNRQLLSALSKVRAKSKK